MLGNRAIGFTFLELIVVIVIMGILATIIVPNLRTRLPGYERKQFINHLNALLKIAQHNAITTNKTHKILFDLEKENILVQVQTDKKLGTGEYAFENMNSRYINSKYEWPKNMFGFKNFYINKLDEISTTLKGENKGKIWFFIIPEGLAQPVIINMLDLKDLIQQMPKEFSLVLNPFSSQFKQHDTFQRP